MTDPGRPFGVAFEALVEVLETRLRDGTDEVRDYRFPFHRSASTQAMPTGAEAIARVSAPVGGVYTDFEPGADYQFTGNHLVWNGGRVPDEGSRVNVEYTWRGPRSGLTDFRDGSVAASLVRALARELKTLYDQMDEAYRRGFVDTASGVALDNVVALLGLTRNVPRKSEGAVIYSRASATGPAVTVPAGSRVADAEGHTFATLADAVIDSGTESAPVRIEASDGGPQGNVAAGVITIMPTPPRGVNSVVNPSPTQGGLDAEPDDQLRERAKHELERAGHATLDALRFAVLSVGGVEEVEVLDQAVDAGIPLGEVRLRYAATGDQGRVRAAVDDAVAKTRAAGILVVSEPVETVLVRGEFLLVAEPGATPGRGAFLARARETLNALTIGAPLSVRRLAALAYGVPGLADVAESRLEVGGAAIVTDPYVPGRTQVLRPDRDLREVLLTRLEVASTRVLKRSARAQLRVRADTGPASFRAFELKVRVDVSARDRSAPDDPPKLIESAPDQTVTFTGGATAPCEIPTGAFDPETHAPEISVSFSTPGYPGLAPATADLDMSDS